MIRTFLVVLVFRRPFVYHGQFSRWQIFDTYRTFLTCYHFTNYWLYDWTVWRNKIVLIEFDSLLEALVLLWVRIGWFFQRWRGHFLYFARFYVSQLSEDLAVDLLTRPIHFNSSKMQELDSCREIQCWHYWWSLRASELVCSSTASLALVAENKSWLVVGVNFLSV